MCADGGSYMPPMLNFPRVRLRPELMDGASPGSRAEVHPSGWIPCDIFLRWFKKCIMFSRASQTHRVLLCFPPHCTHKLLPLDVAFIKPLSVYYCDKVKKWLREHAKDHRVVTHFQIASLFGKAYLKAATMTTAISGFKTTGIWPLDLIILIILTF